MSKGRFGIHGAQYIPETLMNAVIELEEAYKHDKDDPEFNRELTTMLNEYAGRAQYVAITDEEAVEAFEYLSRTEGIIPAIESAHAIAHAMKLAPTMGKDKIIVVNVSGRGDKDCVSVARYRGEDLHE